MPAANRVSIAEYKTASFTGGRLFRRKSSNSIGAGCCLGEDFGRGEESFRGGMCRDRERSRLLVSERVGEEQLERGMVLKVFRRDMDASVAEMKMIHYLLFAMFQNN